jgi:nitroimidazol reductase NimA-like FMN-containing flavoprotein (pyridoxamine 5'-phosphate oxidase superfamily)
VTADDTGLSVLDEVECMTLLAGVHVGRVAVTIGAVPAVFPVNFGVVDGAIVFRTGTGTKLDAATRNAVVAFEVDDLDPPYHEGWSVLVVGVADELTDPALLERAEALPLAPWAPGTRDHLVRLQPEFISGRRIVQGAPAANGTATGGRA